MEIKQQGRASLVLSVSEPRLKEIVHKYVASESTETVMNEFEDIRK